MPPALFALSTAFLFALHNVLIKKGLSSSDTGTAVLTSLAVNIVILWTVALVTVPFHYLTAPAVLLFLVVGLFQPGLTRLNRPGGLPHHCECSYNHRVETSHLSCRWIGLIISLIAFVIIGLVGGVETSSAEWLRWVDGNGVVHLTDNLESIPEPFREYAAPLGIPPTPPRPPEPAKSVSVPLEAGGQVAVVLALLNGNTPANLIVDTGATYTVISYDMAAELRIALSEDTPVTRLQTANGVITAPMVELESVDVGGMKLNQIKAAVHDFNSGRAVVGLLGLNFLKHFRVDIDTSARQLVLERRPQP